MVHKRALLLNLRKLVVVVDYKKDDFVLHCQFSNVNVTNKIH